MHTTLNDDTLDVSKIHAGCNNISDRNKVPQKIGEGVMDISRLNNETMKQFNINKICVSFLEYGNNDYFDQKIRPGKCRVMFILKIEILLLHI